MEKKPSDCLIWRVGSKLKRPFRYTITSESDGWSLSAPLLCLLIISPLLTLLSGIWDSAPAWKHLSETVLPQYFLNTVWLALAVSIVATLMALPAAWLISQFSFPGQKILAWAMVLPLAVPSYVAAFVYRQVPESAIPFLVHLRTQFGVDTYLFAEGLIRKGTLTLLMAAVLYPYLYLSLRTAFATQQKGVIEAAHLLGRSSSRVFFTVALPLARPALIAGITLIIMEVINDYGAVYFMGVPTLTVGIFRTWTGLGDLTSAVRLAGIMVLAVFFLLGIEQFQRGKARFSDQRASSAPHGQLRPLGGYNGILALITCLIPVSFGFILPCLQLLQWAKWSITQYGLGQLPWSRMGHSLLLALITAIVLTTIAVILNFAQRLHPRPWLQLPIRFAGVGYAIPGAVVAVGIMLFLGKISLIGTVYAICFGYVVRFLAVGLHPVRAGMEKVCGSLDQASRVLGHTPTQTLFKVNLPLIRGTLFAVIMLVFVDILKELPMTMILRPVDFDTLATLAFGLAVESRIAECAIPSLMIIFLAGVGLFSLNRLLSSSSRTTES
ncbi:iron ABC transporter permease [Kiritimatiellaeota bacterium B1221]|nr:iron ABC transporter permease [Kiritimatiellaeota bacterium B1221]